MPTEIERKFLVKHDFKSHVLTSLKIVQGYLSSNPERNVRVRITGEKAFLTIKGIASKTGMSRYEWEKEIPVNDAKELLSLCEPGIIDKIRHYIPFNDRTFEVDEFYGDNHGLVIAEIELESENASFEKPDWLGSEVTGDERYYNVSLVKKPYKTW